MLKYKQCLKSTSNTKYILTYAFSNTSFSSIFFSSDGSILITRWMSILQKVKNIDTMTTIKTVNKIWYGFPIFTTIVFMVIVVVVETICNIGVVITVKTVVLSKVGES